MSVRVGLGGRSDSVSLCPTIFAPAPARGISEPSCDDSCVRFLPASGLVGIDADDLDWLPPAGYELIGCLGHGAMGVVYEAFQISTGRRVAIKVMLDSGAGQARLRFEREVELLARLDHSGIVGLIDSGLKDGCGYFIMERIDGVRLDQAAEPGRAPVATVIELISQAADAAAYAHERGVLHRDIKPANILVGKDGRVRLVDFGLAKAFGPFPSCASPRLTLPGAAGLVGTLAYMPPEQAAGRTDDAGPWSDVYSLAAVAYYLLTGRTTIRRAASTREALDDIAGSMIVAPSSLRPGIGVRLDAVLMKALSRRTTDRYESARAFAAALRVATAGGAGERRCPRRPGPMAAVMAAAVCFAAGWAVHERGRAEGAEAKMAAYEATGINAREIPPGWTAAW